MVLVAHLQMRQIRCATFSPPPPFPFQTEGAREELGHAILCSFRTGRSACYLTAERGMVRSTQVSIRPSMLLEALSKLPLRPVTTASNSESLDRLPGPGPALALYPCPSIYILGTYSGPRWRRGMVSTMVRGSSRGDVTYSSFFLDGG